MTARSVPLGRRRDPSRDASILDATLDVLAEVGASGLTMDLVAARAGAGKATIYRRWTSKSALLMDAVGHLKRLQVNLDDLPDTGSLRGDLIALARPLSAEDNAHRLKIVAGLVSLLDHEQDLAEAASEAVIQPWAEAHRILLQRAVQRGEVAARIDIGTLSQVAPTMAAYRTLVQRQPFDPAFLIALVDSVIMPAVRL